MKIIVLGGEGMLGHKMFQFLSARYPGTRCTIIGSLTDDFYRSISLFTPHNTLERINAMNLDSMHRMLQNERPDFIINCIGIVKQRHEIRAAIPTITINSLLPHLIAEWAVAWKGRLIHFSTDCVFSGKRGNYNEDDFSDCEDLYGKSKYLGEVNEKNALTLRTSIIGRELDHFKSLLEWLLTQNGKQVKGFRRVIYSGITTNQCAKLVSEIIRDYPELSGLYQVTGPAISKYDLIGLLRDAYQLNIEIVADDTVISDRSMRGEHFFQATGYKEPFWDDLIAQLVEDKTPYDLWKGEKVGV